MRRRSARVLASKSGFAGFRFPPEVIMVAVRWYLRYGLSYRDVEELLAERGITVDHVTVYRWVQRFTPQLIDAARPCRHAPGNRWCVDETYVKVAGRWVYLYRAIDQYRRLCCIDGRQDVLGLWRRGSDGVGEFSEDCRELMPPIDIDAEFVVTAAQVLHKRVSRADHVGRA